MKVKLQLSVNVLESINESLSGCGEHMAEIVLPKRRFAPIRRIVRQYTPGLYGWMLGNATLRRAFTVIKGKQRIIAPDDTAQKFTLFYETH
jgi:hypothetical protein